MNPASRRALLIVLDSVGVGSAPDAEWYGDAGSDTSGHILDRKPDLSLPNLWSLGLGHVVGRRPAEVLAGSYGRMREQSAGKDSMTGHWELAGVILDEPFAVFERFPEALVQAIEADAGVRFLGNVAASGTQIIQDLGEEHLRSGRPILYTSADSVLQIAAHEERMPLSRLYDLCRIARKHSDAYRIGRVIARPFIGKPGAFIRTAGRHDYGMQPPRTVLHVLSEAGLPVIGIGKAVDLYSGEGITEAVPTSGNREGMERITEVWQSLEAGFVLANLVDFDTLYGHRRDVEGYARALAEFDRWLGEFLPSCRERDLCLITADHGNDPTFRGTDHTREEVPLLVRYGSARVNLGCRNSFADVAATLAEYFGVPATGLAGMSFWKDLTLSGSGVGA